MIVTIRTDSAHSQLQLIDETILAEKTWQADRTLAKTMYSEIEQLLARVNASFDALKGVVVYQGPGSFTGLRIGVTVANTIAYGLSIPIVGVSGENWEDEGIQMIKQGENHTMVLPAYGQEATITAPKK